MIQLKVFSTNAVNAALTELIPVFERESGHKTTVDFNSTEQILDRVRSGETADVVIATAPAIDELARLGKIVAGSRADLGSTGVGVGVRAGAHKPDLGSTEAFRRALLDANSIAYASRGVGGMLLERLIGQLGIAAQIKPKCRTIPGGLVGELVVRGEAELCVQMVSEILAVEGCELAGPLPPELQQNTMFAAAVFAGTPHADAAQALIGFLTGPAAARTMKTRGLALP